MSVPQTGLMEKIVALCKRRGFVYPASEIYGGLTSCWDYGPLGTELKRNVKEAWWKEMVTMRDDIVGLDSAIMQSPKVWEASGHLKNFSDPMVDCRECKSRFRADHIDIDAPCPNCKAEKSFTEARQFNLMFKTFMGPVEKDASIVYLRPETAQGIFTNFKNVLQSSRVSPPFGIAQVGKSFRNEITPGNFVFRTREFEQMEMEFFIPPSDRQKWFEYWVEQRFSWYVKYGIREQNLTKRVHEKEELAFYSDATTDIEYRYPWGFGELEGVASRTDYDLTQHATHAKEKLEYIDPQGNRYIPNVIEPAAGADRATLAFLLDAYEEEEVDGDTRVVLKLHPQLAPITIAVLPLVNKDGIPDIAQKLTKSLKEEDRYKVVFDKSGAIGKRYRRYDEAGTPFCITVDYDSKDDDTATVRYRDSMKQERVKLSAIASLIHEKVKTHQRGQ